MSTRDKPGNGLTPLRDASSGESHDGDGDLLLAHGGAAEAPTTGTADFDALPRIASLPSRGLRGISPWQNTRFGLLSQI